MQEAAVDLETDTPRVIRIESADDAGAFLEREATGVVYPVAITAERVGDDLEALLAEEISHEEFIERSRTFFEDPPYPDQGS